MDRVGEESRAAWPVTQAPGVRRSVMLSFNGPIDRFLRRGRERIAVRLDSGRTNRRQRPFQLRREIVEERHGRRECLRRGVLSEDRNDPLDAAHNDDRTCENWLHGDEAGGPAQTYGRIASCTATTRAIGTQRGEPER